MPSSPKLPKSPKKILSLRIEVLLLSIFVLILSQGLNTFLSTISFEKQISESITAGNRVVARDLPNKLERALKYGKRIEKFYGIETLMEDVRRDNPQFTNLEVYQPDGRVLYSLTPGRKTQQVSPEWLGKSLVEGDGVDEMGQTILLFPVHDLMKKQVATVAITLDPELIKGQLAEHLAREVRLSLFLLAGAAAFLIIALRLFVPIREDGTEFPRRRLFAVVFLTIIVSQIIFASLGIVSLKGSFVELTRGEVERVATQLEQDLEKLLDKGLPLEGLFNLEGMLNKVMLAAPSIDRVMITDAGGRQLYQSENTPASDPRVRPAGISDSEVLLGQLLAEEHIVLSRPLHVAVEAGNPRIAGQVKIEISNAFLQHHLQDFVFNALTILLVSILFLTEILIFFLLYIRQKHSAQVWQAQGRGSYELIRTAMSVFLFGYMMSVSFIPLQMQQLVQKGAELSLPVEIMSSLPVSVEMLFALLAVLVAGGWSDRRGWHQPFLWGIFLSACGIGMSGMAGDAWSFVLWRGLAGFGYGLAWMAAQNFILAKADMGMRARSLASLAAGIMTGYLCGNAVGAMLADRIGFSWVLLLSAGFVLLPLPFVWLFMRTSLQRLKEVSTSEIQKLPKGVIWAFFRDPQVLLVLLLSVIPVAVCQVGFINFATPYGLKGVGVSQADIGRVIMLFGVTMVYFGPWVSRFIDGPLVARKFLVIGGLCAGTGLLLVSWQQNLFGYVAAVFLVGLACCFALSAQTVVIQSLPVVQSVGSGLASSMERMVGKFGQMLGPLLLGSVFASGAAAKGLTWMGAIITLLSLCLLITAGKQAVMVRISGGQDL